ncbi:MAG: hypothetical protein ACHP82_09775 [Hyphomicrobiales bacterium]
MKLKNLGYAALMTIAATAFVLGTTGSSEAAKKKAAAAPPPPPVICFEAEKRVCAVKGGMKFTYINACTAAKDGAKVVSQKACPAPKAKKAKAKKAAKKPAKK